MKLLYPVLITLLLSACGGGNALTKKEMAIQTKADNTVSTILFDNDLSETASYNVKKDGSVVIKFAESVSSKNYTKVVDLLRSNKAVNSVYAEQSGAEVCGTP